MGLYPRDYASGKRSWYARVRHHGKQYVSTAQPSKELAKLEEARMLDALMRGRLEEEFGAAAAVSNKTIKEASKLYLEHIARENAASTVVRKRGIFDNMADSIGKIRVGELTRLDVERYKRARREKVTGTTVNRELATLSHFMNWAREQGLTGDNPVRGVKRFPENADTWRHLSLQQAEDLLAACKAVSKKAPHLHAIVVMALFTGMRRGEILALRWDDVDLCKGEVYVRRTKTGSRSSLPLHPRVVEALRKLKRRGPFIFAHRDGTPVADVKRSFATAVKKAGLAPLRFHDLRHTFASWLVERGVDLFTVQELMGHKSLAMTRRYAHLSPRHKRAAVMQLGSELTAATDSATGEQDEAEGSTASSA